MKEEERHSICSGWGCGHDTRKELIVDIDEGREERKKINIEPFSLFMYLVTTIERGLSFSM